MIYFLGLLSTIFGVGLFLSIKKNMELIERLEAVMEQVEESLEILDRYYVSIDKKSKLELLTDDPTTRELVQDIKGSKDAILLVANKIVESIEEKKEEEKKETT